MLKLIFLFIVALVFTSCRNDIEQVKQTAKMYEPSLERASNIIMYYSTEGIQKMTLKAPLIIRHQVKEAYLEFPDGIEIEFYGDSSTTGTKLTARKAIKYEAKNETIFSDSVHIINANGYQLFTDELIWDENKQSIKSDKFVKIVTPDERLTGTGLSAKQDLSNYKILNITGTVHVKKNTNDKNL